MKPDDLCMVDMTGKQTAGRRKATSEIKLHLAIMKERPELKSVVHCHPPHATAFGIAREPIPQCVLPEVEIFLGDVPVAKYDIPGSRTSPTRFCPSSRSRTSSSWPTTERSVMARRLRKAYWATEILDAYCRMLILARNLGKVNYFTESEAQGTPRPEDRMGIPGSASRRCRTASSAPTTSSATVGRSRELNSRPSSHPSITRNTNKLGRRTQPTRKPSFRQSPNASWLPCSREKANSR